MTQDMGAVHALTSAVWMQHEVAEPKGLPWDWHLEPRPYPLNLQFTGSLAQSVQEDATDSALEWCVVACG